jgi:hypothetical protein
MSEHGLKLRAVDAPDLQVIAAALQDAAVPISDMRYFAGPKQFALAVSRFRWELPETGRDDAGGGERVNAGLIFEHVRGVRSRRLDLGDRTQVLDLLTIQAGDGHVDLLFAGGATVRLEIDRIECRLEDYGEPWPTIFRPKHAIDEGS